MATQRGYLVLADISGYTSYLSSVELDHAHEILTDLLETIVGRLKPVLTISKLEGDAVFGYVPEAKVARGETLLELIENTYVAFRARVDSVFRRTTCECKACRAIPTLDLKFLVHHGDFIVQTVSGINELVGSDVNLVHRLLKNHVGQATGWKAYALFSDKVTTHLGLQIDGLHTQSETYEHLGQVLTHSFDLHPRYRQLVDGRRVYISAEDADFVCRLDIPAPPALVWEWYNDPRRRNEWNPDTHWRADVRPGGRTGVGARNHCAHGKNVSIETVEDWRPFDYVTMSSKDSGMPASATLMETIQLTPLPDGRTRLVANVRVDGMPLPRWLSRPMFRLMMLHLFHYDRALKRMAEMVAADAAQAAPEPEPARQPQ